MAIAFHTTFGNEIIGKPVLVAFSDKNWKEK